MKKMFTHRLNMAVLLLLNLSCYAAEPAMLQCNSRPGSAVIEEALALGREADAITEQIQQDLEIGKQVDPFGELWEKRSALWKQRNRLLEQLSDEGFTDYLAHHYQGRILIDDRPSYKEGLPLDHLHRTFPRAISNIIGKYMYHTYGIRWKKANILHTASAISPHGSIRRCNHIQYRLQDGNSILIIPPWSRTPYESSEGEMLLIVPDERLQAYDSFFEQYSSRKPSAQELGDLRASNKYSAKTLELLGNGILFNVPVLEPVDEKEDS